MSLLRRRMMLQQEQKQKKLFDINTARTDVESWRDLVYSIQDDAIIMLSGSYSWTGLNVYFDNCKNGDTYQLSFKISSEREILPSCSLYNGKTSEVLEHATEIIKTFTCEENTPYLMLY